MSRVCVSLYGGGGVGGGGGTGDCSVPGMHDTTL